jgi:hypothetical protein
MPPPQRYSKKFTGQIRRARHVHAAARRRRSIPDTAKINTRQSSAKVQPPKPLTRVGGHVKSRRAPWIERLNPGAAKALKAFSPPLTTPKMRDTRHQTVEVIAAPEPAKFLTYHIADRSPCRSLQIAEERDHAR